MATLSEHINVYDAARFVLLEKGYQVWWVRIHEETFYFAEKGGWDFAAKSPIHLLGLVAVYEDRVPGEYRDGWWNRGEGARALRVPVKPQPYDPVMQRS